ncbi:MAG: 4Fe-4S binding protein [Acidobacteria bacterium]|nr:4Fe-4S binding protein [Acidobacteriota bacterium]
MTGVVALVFIAGAASLAQEQSASPGTGRQPQARAATAETATAPESADRGDDFAPGWMEKLLESSEEVEDVDPPGTPPHEHPTGTAAHAHSHTQAGAAHEDAPTPDAPVVRGVLLATLVFAGAGLFFARRSLTAAPAEKTSGRWRLAGANVLDWPVIGKLLRWRHFNTLLTAPTLGIFLFIIATGLFAQQDTSNPAILLTWILWWPAVIFSFLLLGRIWCTACPFGYMGDVAQKIFCLQKKVPKIFRNMWWQLGLFLALTWATTMWALDRWPWGTAWLALSITLGAIAFGFLFEKRAFCRYVCPVGGIFGLYSMTAPVRIGVKDKRICQEECRTKNCFKACAWWEFAPTMERNLECNLCLDCVRACPHDNIVLRAQPTAADLAEFRPHRRSLDEGITVAAVLGVSLLQTAVMLNAWTGWEARIGALLGLSPGPFLYTLIFLTLGVVFPTLLFGIVAYLSSPGEQRRSDVFSALRIYAYAFLPLGLALHAAHNFHHLLGEGEAMVLGVRKALADYSGWEFLAPPDAASAAAVLGSNTMFLLQGAALLGGLYLAFRLGTTIVRRNVPSHVFRTALPIFLFAVAYTILNILILAAPMAHRH